MSDTVDPVVMAFVLLAAGLVLIWLEVLVVSFGLLGVAAAACIAGAAWFAFQVNDALGWAFALGGPLVSLGVLLLGVRRMSRSRVVLRGEVSAAAGYSDAMAERGVGVGTVGVMLTPALPSGRARFDAATCDVRAQAGTLARDDRVRVVAVDGSSLVVVRVDTAPPNINEEEQ